MNRKYSPTRRSTNYEYKVGSIADFIFFILVVVMIIKLYAMFGG